MPQDNSGKSLSGWLIALGVGLTLLGGIAGWFWHSVAIEADPAAQLAKGDRAAIEQVVREYILDNPEILPQAMENLQRQETAKRLTGVREEVEAPFPGAVLGNPEGSVTLVEFTDFACGYCRRSVEDIEALIAEHPDLRVVVREMPILSPHSKNAAQMALAAAEQGKYAEFHRAMFEAGRPSPETVEAAALSAGLDMKRARATAQSDHIEAELKRNIELAGQLGFDGTPSWIAGDQLISGAVGKERLAEAIEEARS